MSGARVRRGGGAKAKTRKSSPKASVSRRIAKTLPVDQARANRLAGLVFTTFLLAIGVVVLVALDIPAKAERSAGAAFGRAGFVVSGYQIVGLKHMDRAPIDAVLTDELRRASDAADGAKPPQPLVDVSAIRNRLLQFGWIKDARVSRRLPDTLVIDIVERTPSALWQNQGQLALIDREGVVLDRVPITRMPDLPLLIGPGANLHSEQLDSLMGSVPTLKPQLASATWVGGRRWDLSLQTGETLALPEGASAASAALQKFAKLDRSSGLLGRGLVRFDLRIPGKMIVRLAHPPAASDAATPAQQG